MVPTSILVFLDSISQWTGAFWQLSPSVFMRAKLQDGKEPEKIPENLILFFKCPACGHSPLINKENYLECSNCQKKWEVKDGIFDFREPIEIGFS
jgi:hypothetical protein